MTKSNTTNQPLSYAFKLNAADLFLIILVPFAVTLLSFYTKSFWGDEILSINFSANGLKNLVDNLSSDYHPPLYFLILKVWLDIFGSSELVLRIFQGLQGCLFLAFSLILFRKLLPGYRYHPFWLLLITSSELWLFMPMLRYYTLAATLTIFSTLVLFKWLNSNDKRITFLLGFSYVLLLYTDYPSSVLILFHLVYTIFKKKELLLKLILTDAAATLLFSPWMFITLIQINKLLHPSRSADMNLSPKVIPLKIGYSLYAFIFGEMTYPFEAIAIAIMILLMAVLVLNFSKILKVFSDVNFRYVFWLCLTGIVFTSIVTTFISTHTSFIYTPSRTFFGLPFLFLFFAMIYSKINRSFYKYMLIAAFLIANIYGISNWVMNRHFLMPVYATPWKEVLDNLQGSKGIIIAEESLCYEYYKNNKEGVFPELKTPNTIQDLYTSSDTPTNVFLILMGRESTESGINKEIVDYIQNKGTKLSEKKFLLIDESYKKIKSKVLGRESYDAKLTLFKYELPLPAK